MYDIIVYTNRHDSKPVDEQAGSAAGSRRANKRK